MLVYVGIHRSGSTLGERRNGYAAARTVWIMCLIQVRAVDHGSILGSPMSCVTKILAERRQRMYVTQAMSRYCYLRVPSVRPAPPPYTIRQHKVPLLAQSFSRLPSSDHDLGNNTSQKQQMRGQTWKTTFRDSSFGQNTYSVRMSPTLYRTVA